MVSGATRRGANREVLLCAALLGAAGLLVYEGALEGFFLADDYTILGSFWGKGTAYLAKLLVSDEIGGVWPEKFLRPMRPWSLALDGWMWGLEPFGFHLTNLLLHVGTATAIAALVLQLGGGLHAALPASLLFLLHPLNVEVATWVSGRDESLACAALLGAVSCSMAAARGGKKKIWFVFAAALFTLSLFAKEYALLLPIAMWVWAVLAPQDGRSRLDALKTSLARSVPLLLILVAFLALRYQATGHPLGGYGAGASAHVALRPDLLLSSFGRFGLALLSPAVERPIVAAALGLGFLVPLAATRNPNGAPRLELIVFWALLWPTLFLMPTHNLAYTPRHLYISFAGIAVAFGLLLARTGGKWRSWCLALGAGLPILLAAPTLAAVEEYTRMSNRCRAILSSVEIATSAFPRGEVVVLVGMPTHRMPPWGFGWSIEDALRPPFVATSMDSRLEVLYRRQWRSTAWAAFRDQHPGRRIHALAWNPAFLGVEILRDDGLSPAAGNRESGSPLPRSID